MVKKIISCIAIISISLTSKTQSIKSTKKLEQLWFGYYSQFRLNNNWELSTDVQLRTRENFVDQFSQSILRMGISCYLNTFIKLSVGYAYSEAYNSVSGIKFAQTEHRPWQQLQWENIYGKNRLVQRFRLEERFRQKILKDTTGGEGYNFNYRGRFNIGYEIALNKKGSVQNLLSLVLNEEININFGKAIIYNYFDQNRLFVGLKYQFDRHNNLTVGYMNQFQQTAAGNKYIKSGVFRFIYLQNFDFRKANL